MATCTSQLVEFVGSELQSSGLCHIVFLINLGLKSYLKVTNADRNEPRGFWRHSKLTNLLKVDTFIFKDIHPDYLNCNKTSFFPSNSNRICLRIGPGKTKTLSLNSLLFFLEFKSKSILLTHVYVSGWIGN